MLNESQGVCVIIPAYNAGEVIARCLQSLLEQSFRDWTAIVIDDGSTDATPAEIARLAQQDERIRAIQGRHAGASAARNQGWTRLSISIRPTSPSWMRTTIWSPTRWKRFIRRAHRRGRRSLQVLQRIRERPP